MLTFNYQVFMFYLWCFSSGEEFGVITREVNQDID